MWGSYFWLQKKSEKSGLLLWLMKENYFKKNLHCPKSWLLLLYFQRNEGILLFCMTETSQFYFLTFAFKNLSFECASTVIKSFLPCSLPTQTLQGTYPPAHSQVYYFFFNYYLCVCCMRVTNYSTHIWRSIWDWITYHGSSLEKTDCSCLIGHWLLVALHLLV